MKPRNRTKTIALPTALMNSFRGAAIALGKEPTDILKDFVEKWLEAEAAKAVKSIKQHTQTQAKVG